MIQWYAVFVLLLFQMALCILLVLPLPFRVRSAILSAIAKAWNNPTFNIVIKTICGLLLVLFFDSLRNINNISTSIEEKRDVAHVHGKPNCEHYLRLFREQRNSYVVGFSLFLFLMLYRFKEMLLEQQVIERKSSAVIKQAENAQKEYSRLSTESGEGKKSLDKANETIADLKKQLLSLEAIKKQAENTSKEYLRLLEENNELHDKNNAKGRGQKKDD